ncbi:trans-sulfuration enzyme family protein [Thalassobacillus hwangdonensis]|uniref:Trans-sulfuration enzyme family protein n=1 Tax=Thalassobacillus hwangdonensis TaxID=546108 RepID=A0ABW3KZQ7_9BACI
MREKSFETSVVHSEHKLDVNSFKSKRTPIYQTSVFSFSDLDELEGYYSGENAYLYSRMGNPNTDGLGHTIAQLEGAPAGVAASSGMAAILAGILVVAKHGDHIIASEDLYGGTFHLLEKELKDFGIEVTFVAMEDIESVEQAIQPRTKLLYSESITNPFLRVENIGNMIELADKYELTTMIDNTFATPYLLTPFTEGVDLVVHSATKYIGGHSDVTAGVLVGRESLIQTARSKIVSLGMNLSPFEAWLAERGTKTLALRMKKQSVNAEYVAERLRNHADVEQVYYPAFVSEKGNGAIVSIKLKDRSDMHKFFAALDWIKIVPSLAGVETSVSYPVATSHRALSEDQRKKLGIDDTLVRISIGIEDEKDILYQLEAAIDHSL